MTSTASSTNASDQEASQSTSDHEERLFGDAPSPSSPSSAAAAPGVSIATGASATAADADISAAPYAPAAAVTSADAGSSAVTGVAVVGRPTRHPGEIALQLVMDFERTEWSIDDLRDELTTNYAAYLPFLPLLHQHLLVLELRDTSKRDALKAAGAFPLSTVRYHTWVCASQARTYQRLFACRTCADCLPAQLSHILQHIARKHGTIEQQLQLASAVAKRGSSHKPKQMGGSGGSKQTSGGGTNGKDSHNSSRCDDALSFFGSHAAQSASNTSPFKLQKPSSRHSSSGRRIVVPDSFAASSFSTQSQSSRTHAEREHQAAVEACKRLLEKLRRRRPTQDHSYFNSPINFDRPADSDYVPSYADFIAAGIITQPMDLGTVHAKLYASPCGYGHVGDVLREFKFDVELVYDNALCFHQSDEHMYEVAHAAKAWFIEQLAQLEERFADKRARRQSVGHEHADFSYFDLSGSDEAIDNLCVWHPASSSSAAAAAAASSASTSAAASSASTSVATVTSSAPTTSSASPASALPAAAPTVVPAAPSVPDASRRRVELSDAPLLPPETSREISTSILSTAAAAAAATPPAATTTVASPPPPPFSSLWPSPSSATLPTSAATHSPRTVDGEFAAARNDLRVELDALLAQRSSLQVECAKMQSQCQALQVECQTLRSSRDSFCADLLAVSTWAQQRAQQQPVFVPSTSEELKYLFLEQAHESLRSEMDRIGVFLQRQALTHVQAQQQQQQQPPLPHGPRELFSSLGQRHGDAAAAAASPNAGASLATSTLLAPAARIDPTHVHVSALAIQSPTQHIGAKRTHTNAAGGDEPHASKKHRSGAD